MRPARSALGFLALVSLGLACEPHVAFHPIGQDTQHLDAWLLLPARDVDILFVIDDSTTMGQAQATLANGIDPLFDLLEDPELRANYRIGVTTTDNGNPLCSTTSEKGALVASSCLTRLDDFVSGSIDDQALACQDVCTLSDAELEILPTATDVDSTLVARPWLEHVEHRKNIPTDTDMADAFRCFAPQGIAGCGFESPLESMYLALDQNYGFLRDGAVLAIVIVSDETDCSYEPAFADIFSPEGNKVFWSDPSAALPTSAVCWNAGVECTGDPSGYDGCEPVDKDLDGNVDVQATSAVLRPIQRYLDFVQALEDQRRDINPAHEVIVALIGGVANDGSVSYADDLVDPMFQDECGIGPGCVAADDRRAVPPVRERVFTEEFSPGNLFSICEPDFTPAFEAIASQIRAELRPTCYSRCVADMDPFTEILDPDCAAFQELPNGDETGVVECQRNADGSYAIDPATMDYVMPSDEVDVCYALRVDSTGLTSDPADDLSVECSDFAYNLEFAIARRPGVPAPGGTEVGVQCWPAQFPDVDCPNIGNPN